MLLNDLVFGLQMSEGALPDSDRVYPSPEFKAAFTRRRRRCVWPQRVGVRVTREPSGRGRAPDSPGSADGGRAEGAAKVGVTASVDPSRLPHFSPHQTPSPLHDNSGKDNSSVSSKQQQRRPPHLRTTPTSGAVPTALGLSRTAERTSVCAHWSIWLPVTNHPSLIRRKGGNNGAHWARLLVL